MKKNILDPTVFSYILLRINSLSPESKRVWGSMSVDEMLCHCQQPLKNALQITHAKLEANKIKSLVFRFVCVTILKQFPKGAPTGPDYDIKKSKIKPKEMEDERMALISLLNQFFNYSPNISYGIHPLFGNMNNKQWGIITYMHLDHHLRQFSA